MHASTHTLPEMTRNHSLFFFIEDAAIKAIFLGEPFYQGLYSATTGEWEGVAVSSSLGLLPITTHQVADPRQSVPNSLQRMNGWADRGSAISM